ncbi:hypothetical protein FACS1894124_2190 [Spirochaetia bacterium]|nr:hypothetical protein FACS1894124_2190 [Spirochaetia bacterium]
MMKKRVDKTIKLVRLMTALAAMVIAAGCNNFLAPDGAKPGVGKGLVTISIGDAAGRTLLPALVDLVIDSWELTFTKASSEDPVTITDWDGTAPVELDEGTWSLALAAKKDGVAVASGATTADFTVVADTTATAAVNLVFAAPVAGQEGRLEYDIIGPTGTTLDADGIAVVLRSLSDGTDVSVGTTLTGSKTDVPAGYYLVIATLTAGAQEAVKSDAAHIYQDQVTKVAWTFEDDDFHKLLIPAAFTGVTADGSATATTTKLTLTFSQAITGLATDDITLTAGTTGAAKGALAPTGTAGVYELAVSGITETGNVTVAVVKPGYTISGSPQTAQVYYSPRTGKAITNFHISAPVTAAGIINEADTDKTIAVSLPYGTAVTEMTATVVISAGAAIDPDPTMARSYSSPVKYTVTAEDGGTAEYTVTVVIAAADEKRIDQFKIEEPAVTGTITEGAISVTVPYNTDVTAMKAEAAFAGKSIAPDPELEHDYSSPFQYTVTANDGTSIQYTVTVSIAAITGIQVKTPPAKTSYIIGDEFDSTGLKITASDDIGTTDIPLAAGYSVVEPADFTTVAGTKTITVTHTASGQTATFDVTVLNAAAFTGVTADGGATTATTTKLTLTFAPDITGLEVGDITLTAGTTGATKGALAPTATAGVYELAVSGITAGGTVTVSVTKTGYDISGGSQTAQVYYVVAATFTGVTADGGATTATTTKLTLTFDKDISGLEEDDITLSGITGVTKGTLTPTATAGVYELGVTVTASGTVTVSVTKTGYNISGSPQTAEVYYVVAAAFTGVTADGGATTATTTKLTLTFDKDISGLEEDDITLSGITGATKGALTPKGSGVYELPISSITASETVTVSVTKTGYNISGGSQTAQVYYVVAAVFTGLTADGGATTGTTTKLTLTFDKAITGLEAGDITLTGSTGATKGNLTSVGTGVYELPISGITASGSVTVAVSKSGYAISPTSKNVAVTLTGGMTIPLGVVDQGGSLTLTGAAPFTVYRTGANQSATVSVSASGYTYTWYVGEESVGTGSSITIKATDYSLGKHQLVLAAKDATNVIWTAAPIAFTVAANHD